MDLLAKDVKVGCCGFPEARARYYKELSVVEVQQTFYQPPPLKTALKWRKEAPASCMFNNISMLDDARRFKAMLT